MNFYVFVIEECLYNTEIQLFKKLKQFSINPRLVRRTEMAVSIYHTF